MPQEIDTDVKTETWKVYREELTRFVRNRVNDAAMAEDLVHDVLVRAYEHRDTLRERDRLRPWLYRIARNAVIDYYRTRRPTEGLPKQLEREAPAPAGGAMQELTRCVTPLIEELPAHYREAVVLYEFEGLKQREIAEKMDLSVSGAKSRVQRGRAQLEALLFACCRFERDARGGVIDYEKKGNCNAC